MKCNVCRSEISKPIYQSHGNSSITSLCELQAVETVVYFCGQCGHLMSPPMAAADKYYASDYKILLTHDAEDQIYDAGEGAVVYRTEHQLATLTKKLQLTECKQMLDYGCAKSTMTKRLQTVFPTNQYYLFDVSDMYVSYWEKMLPASNWAIDHTPQNWQDRFDLVTSFFSLEHITEPTSAVLHIHSLLKMGGRFYGIVPNVFTNPADFVVVDHNNHFTHDSLNTLLAGAGFGNIEIDSHSHRGAYIFTATKMIPATPSNPNTDLAEQVNGLAEFWTLIKQRIREMEIKSDAPYAIYGSGFYGAFIYANIEKKDQVKCFLDRSPFQQNKKLFGLSILAPEALPSEIQTLFVGLNPNTARDIMRGNPTLNNRSLQMHFLD